MRHSALIAALFTVGCVGLQPAAADPPAPAQAAVSQDATQIPPAAATSTPPATLAAVAPSASKAADGAASTGITDAQIKKYRAKGYKPQVHNGKTVFCHSEANLGSRLEHQVCRTAEQLEEDSQQGQDMARDIQHGGTISVRSSP